MVDANCMPSEENCIVDVMRVDKTVPWSDTCCDVVFETVVSYDEPSEEDCKSDKRVSMISS